MCHARNTLGTTLTVLAVLALAGCHDSSDPRAGVGRHAFHLGLAP